MVNTNIHIVKLNKYLSSKAFNTVTTLTLNLNALIVIAKTPVKFPKPTNDRWYFEAKMGLFGRQLAVHQPLPCLVSTFFSSADQLCVGLSKLYLFCVCGQFVQVNQSLNSPSSNPRLSSDRRQTDFMSVVGRLAFRHLALNLKCRLAEPD